MLGLCGGVLSKIGETLIVTGPACGDVKGRTLHSNSRGGKETELFFQVEMGPDSKASYVVENEVGERDIWKQG